MRHSQVPGRLQPVAMLSAPADRANRSPCACAARARLQCRPTLHAETLPDLRVDEPADGRSQLLGHPCRQLAHLEHALEILKRALPVRGRDYCKPPARLSLGVDELSVWRSARDVVAATGTCRLERRPAAPAGSALPPRRAGRPDRSSDRPSGPSPSGTRWHGTARSR